MSREDFKEQFSTLLVNIDDKIDDILNLIAFSSHLNERQTDIVKLIAKKRIEMARTMELEDFGKNLYLCNGDYSDEEVEEVQTIIKNELMFIQNMQNTVDTVSKSFSPEENSTWTDKDSEIVESLKLANNS